MKLPKLYKAKILKKYKMFFLDVILEESGKVVTAYTKNKGGFKEEMARGNYVYVSFHNDPKRKTKYSVMGTNALTGLPAHLTKVSLLIIK